MTGSLVDEAADVQEWPLSPVQEGLVLHHDGSTAYTDQMICEIDGDFDVETFRRTLTALVETHDSLRCRFTSAGGRRFRQVVGGGAELELAVRDIAGEPDPPALVERFAARELIRGFDLATQTSRCRLFRLSPREHVFVWTYHHAIADSWALRLLQDQFCEVYRDLFCFDRRPDIRAPSFKAYLDWVDAQDADAARAFWRDYLARYRPSSTDQPEPALHAGGAHATVRIDLGSASRADVEAARRACRATPNAVVLTAWAVCVLHLTQASECLVGCVNAGRGVPVPGIQAMAGTIANTLPLVISDDTSLEGLVGEVRDRTFATSPYAYLSLGDIVASAGLRPTELHSVVNFTLDRPEIISKHLEDLPFTIPVVRYDDQATFPAYLDIAVAGDDVHLKIRYDPERRFFSAASLQRMLADVLREVAEHPTRGVRQVLDAMMVEDFDIGEAPLEF